MRNSENGIITLFDDYVISVDQYNYSVGRKYKWKNKNGEIENGIKFLSHHHTLPQALESFRRYLVRAELQEGVRTLQEALGKILEVDRKAEEFIRENIPEV